MGLRCFLLLVFFMAFSGCVTSQWKQRLVTISFQDETLDAALRRLGSELDVRFAYDAVVMRERKTSMSFQGASGEQVVTDLLKEHGFSWKEVGSVIAVIPERISESILPPSKTSLRVSGVVKDKGSGETLPYARIEVAHASLFAQTDEYGRFTLERIPADTCELIVAYVGYTTSRIRLSNENLKSLIIELELGRLFLPSAVIEDLIAPLMEFTADPGTILLNPVEIAASSAGGEQDVMRAPQLLPGINGTRENNGGLIIRGSDADQSLVNFDGYTLYHLDHFFGLFSSLNANAVKAVMVHKGPLPASLGGRVGGVVEVLGKDGNNLQPTFKVDAGPLSIGLASDGPLTKSGKMRYLVAYRRALTDVVKGFAFQDLFNTVYNAGRRSSGGDTESSNTALSANYGFQDLTARMSFRPNDSHTFQWSGFFSGDRLALQFRDSSADMRFAILSDNNSTWGNAGTGVRHLYSPTSKPNMRIQSSFGLSRYTSSFVNTDSIIDLFFTENSLRFRNNALDLRDLLLQSAITSVCDSLEMNVGVSFNRIDIRYRESMLENRLLSGSNIGYIATVHGAGDWKRSIGHIYLGGRVNYYSVKNRMYPEWRLGWQKKWNKRWSASLGVGRIFQFIHRIYAQSIFNSTADAWRLSGTESVPVLRSDQLTGTIELKRRKWRWSASPFIKWNTGTFEYLGPYRGWSAGQNDGIIATGNGQIRGVDGLAQYHHGRWNAWTSITWMKAFNTIETLSNDPIPELFDQRLECKVYTEYTVGWWKWSTTMFYGSGTPFTAYSGSVVQNSGVDQSVRFPVYGTVNGARLPAYLRADFTVSRKWMWKRSQMTVLASLQNVSNERNISEIRFFPAFDFNSSGDFFTREVRMLPRLFTLQIHFSFS